MHSGEVDAALARLNHDILGYSLSEGPLVLVHLSLNSQIAVFEVDVRDALCPLLVEGDRLAAAVYMVAGVEAQINVGIIQEALDLLLGLNVAVNVRMEQANEAVRCAAVSALLYILAVGSPLFVGQLRIHLQLAGSEVGVHRRQQNDILSGRESLQQLGDIVDILEHALNSSVIEEVAALGSAYQSQAARVHSVLQNLGIVVRHVAPGTDLAALVAGNLHFVQAAPPLGLFCVVRIACREPYTPGVRCNTNLDSHNYILPVKLFRKMLRLSGLSRIAPAETVPAYDLMQGVTYLTSTHS